MNKFNYVKWKSEKLPGLLTEQVTGPGLPGCPPGSTSGLNLGCQNYGPIYTSTGMVYNGNFPTYATAWTGSCCTGSAGTGSAPTCPSGTGPWAQYPLLDSYISTSTNFTGNFSNPNDPICQSYFEPLDAPTPSQIISCCEQIGFPPTGSCSTSWSNYNNWKNTWTNNNAFNSSNPNQPCNHICQKIQQWTNMGSGTIPLPPVRDNIVQCKLAVGQNQSQIHGCNC